MSYAHTEASADLTLIFTDQSLATIRAAQQRLMQYLLAINTHGDDIRKNEITKLGVQLQTHMSEHTQSTCLTHPELRQSTTKIKHIIQAHIADNIDAVVENHKTLRTLALERQDHETVEFLVDICGSQPYTFINPITTKSDDAASTKSPLTEAKVNEQDSAGNTFLMRCVAEQNLAMVKYLVNECKADPNIENKDEETPLHAAARLADPKMAKAMAQVLIDGGADVNARNKMVITPLIIATQKGHLGLIRYLLNNAKTEIVIYKFEETAIHYAAREGRVDSLVAIAQSRGSIFDKDSGAFHLENENDHLPIHIAALHNQKNMVRHLTTGKIFKDMCSAETMNCMNLTALYIIASQPGSEDMMHFLTKELKASAHTQDKYGDTPLYRAAEKGPLANVRYLVTEHKADVNCANHEGITPLLAAASRRDEDAIGIVRWLAENKADLSAVTTEGHNALHVAVRYGCLEVVKYLLTQKTIQDNITAECDDMTAEQMAISLGYLEIAQAFHAHNPEGLKYKVQEKDGYDHAIMEGRLHIVKWLCEDMQEIPEREVFRLKSNTILTRAYKPLQLASVYGRVNLVQYFYELDPTFLNVGNFIVENTPLHLATIQRHTDVVEFLLKQKGIDVDPKNMHGNTPFLEACENGCLEAALMLLDAGADATITNSYGDSFLHLLLAAGHSELQDTLLRERPKLQTIPIKPNNLGQLPGHLAATNSDMDITSSSSSSSSNTTGQTPPPAPPEKTTPLSPATDMDVDFGSSNKESKTAAGSSLGVPKAKSHSSSSLEILAGLGGSHSGNGGQQPCDEMEDEPADPNNTNANLTSELNPKPHAEENRSISGIGEKRGGDKNGSEQDKSDKRRKAALPQPGGSNLTL